MVRGKARPASEPLPVTGNALNGAERPRNRLENLGLENLGLENLGLENLGGTLRHRSRLKWLQVIGRKSYD